MRDDAGPISFHHAFVRALVGVVEIYVFLGSPAFFAALLSPRSKRLGDYAAGTYVVRERVRLQLPPPVRMPHHLAHWAAHADLTSLPTGSPSPCASTSDGSPARPRLRAEVGGRFAEAVSAHVAPPPPPGTTPEAFLAAVVAARRTATPHA